MMDHTDARTAVSARADGELERVDAATLEEHLATCSECDAFARGVGVLASAVAALPRERAPEWLPERVLREVLRIPARAPRPVRRRWMRLTPVVAFVLAGAIVVALVLQPVPRFALPGAEAAAALSHIRSMTMERDIRELGLDGSIHAITRESIWFRAPGSSRVERTIKTYGPSAVSTTQELEITVPGKHYVKTDANEYLEVNTPPSATSIPEPLSPALAFFGTRTGDGPVIAGRKTIRIELETHGERRVAFIDAQRFTVVESEDSVVLGKEIAPGLRPRLVKRTLSVRYNVGVPDSAFATPGIRPIDYRFREQPVRDLEPAPRALPRGMTLVRSGGSPDGQALLFARGGFSILVEIRAQPQPARPDEQEISSRFGSHDATVIVGFYRVPRIAFIEAGRAVTISAPLPRDALILLATQMYG